MNYGKTLQHLLKQLSKVSGVELSLYEKNGSLLATSLPEEDQELSGLAQVFGDSNQTYKDLGDMHFFAEEYGDDGFFVLAAKGREKGKLVGEIAIVQVKELLETEDDDFDKNTFYQNLIMDHLLLVDIYNKAKKLHIEAENKRVVFVVEVESEQELARQLMKGLYAGKRNDFITAVDEKHIIYIHSLDKKDTEETLENEAHMMADMINMETMINVRVSYGTVVSELKDLAKSYKEAMLALNVGEIFFMEKNIIPYTSLGIGRLIYQLPVSLCEMFLQEVFGDFDPDDLDEDTWNAIQKFYENGLNISKTAQQMYIHRNTLGYRFDKLAKVCGLDIRNFEEAMTFKLATMVSNYLKYIKGREEQE